MEAMFRVVRAEPSYAVEVLVKERADVEVVVLLPRPRRRRLQLPLRTWNLAPPATLHSKLTEAIVESSSYC